MCFEREGSWPGHRMKGSGPLEHWFSDVTVQWSLCDIPMPVSCPQRLWLIDVNACLGIESFNSSPGDSTL